MASFFKKLFGIDDQTVPESRFPVQTLGQIDPALVNPLKERALTGVSAGQMDVGDAIRTVPGIGLGREFTDRAFSPIAKRSDLAFRTQTLPTISSEASKRGLGRSTIATNQIAQADVNRQADLDVLLSQLETLNRQAAKSDISERSGLGENILERERQQANLKSQEAQSRIAQEIAGNQQAASNNMSILSSLVPAVASAGLGVLSPTSILGAGAGTDLLTRTAAGLGGAAMPNTPRANILGSASDDILEEIRKALRGA